MPSIGLIDVHGLPDDLARVMLAQFGSGVPLDNEIEGVVAF